MIEVDETLMSQASMSESAEVVRGIPWASTLVIGALVMTAVWMLGFGDLVRPSLAARAIDRSAAALAVDEVIEWVFNPIKGDRGVDGPPRVLVDGDGPSLLEAPVVLMDEVGTVFMLRDDELVEITQNAEADYISATVSGETLILHAENERFLTSTETLNGEWVTLKGGDITVHPSTEQGVLWILEATGNATETDVLRRVENGVLVPERSVEVPISFKGPDDPTFVQVATPTGFVVFGLVSGNATWEPASDSDEPVLFPAAAREDLIGIRDSTAVVQGEDAFHWVDLLSNEIVRSLSFVDVELRDGSYEGGGFGCLSPSGDSMLLADQTGMTSLIDLNTGNGTFLWNATQGGDPPLWVSENQVIAVEDDGFMWVSQLDTHERFRLVSVPNGHVQTIYRCT